MLEGVDRKLGHRPQHRLEDLVDSSFPIENDSVVFKVMDEDIGDDNVGVTISIGYRAGGVLKYGIFGLLPRGSE